MADEKKDEKKDEKVKPKTEEQIRAEVRAEMEEEALRKKIRAEMEAGDEEHGPGDENALNQLREELRKQKQVKILIPSTENEKDDVPVGINGLVYLIKRDVECTVPEAVIHVLENAKGIRYTQKKREDGEGNELVPREVLRHSYQRF